ncbi:MAG: CsgG/HfaB family protein [Elusimicrobia bacterium]|nr:CsgG/HfaB family protein [Elusimicrobiota bacterium]
MKNILLIIAAALVLGACSANVIVKRTPDPAKPARVAVLPFKPHPAYPASGELAYEAFSTYLLRLKEYSIVDRGALNQLIKEQKLNQTGVIDQGKAVELGKLLGAEGVVLGAVTEYVPRKYLIFPPAKVSLTARMINTRTGEVEWTASHTRGGYNRLFTWIIPAVGIVATIISPSAEDQVQGASRSISKGLEKEFAKTRPQ